jgi:ribosomal protein L11 methyltransferase
MDWLEISVSVEPEIAEAVAEVFSRTAQNAVAIEQHAREDALSADGWDSNAILEPLVHVRAYLPMDGEVKLKRRQIEEGLWHLKQIMHAIPDPIFREVKQDDWENAWKKDYHVVRVGERIVIKPSWREHHAQPGDVVIELDPGMAFGTGLHPTTRMCLQAIEHHMSQDANVLDLGTGSGILAIAAAKLGGASVLALDMDGVAVEAAQENVQRNGLKSMVHVAQGSLADLQTSKHQAFDFVLINILASIIVQLCDAGLADAIAPQGIAVFAGLIDTQETQVREALARAALVPVNRLQEKDWVCLICRRSMGDPK